MSVLGAIEQAVLLALVVSKVIEYLVTPLYDHYWPEGKWTLLYFYPADFTHDPYSGQRVTQFAPDPTAHYLHGTGYKRSGFRHSNSTLRIGNSTDRYTTVETWGNGAFALGSTLLFQPYDDFGVDTVGPADARRHIRRLHRDEHLTHRRLRDHRHARDEDDQDDDGDTDDDSNPSPSSLWPQSRAWPQCTVPLVATDKSHNTTSLL